MSATFDWTDILSAFLAAAATGAFGIYDRRSERKHRYQSTLLSIRAQASFLTSLIRSQEYHSDAREISERSKLPTWNGEILQIDARHNYLDILEDLRGSFGLLKASEIEPVIEFYNRAKIFTDSTKCDGPFLEEASLDERRSHAEQTHLNIERLLVLGDQISQFGVAK